MDITLPSPRLTKGGWLGGRKIWIYPATVRIIIFLASARIFVDIVLLCWILSDATGSAKRRHQALGTLSILLAFIDWVPYSLFAWERRSVVRRKWATPILGAASVIVNGVWVAIVLTHGRTAPPKLMALITFIFATCGAVITNVGLLYFVYPIRLLRVYEPVFTDAELYKGSPGCLSIRSSDGPLATLYQAQGSTLNGCTEETGEQNRQPVTDSVPVSMICVLSDNIK
jgi:hypothetical protein